MFSQLFFICFCSRELAVLRSQKSPENYKHISYFKSYVVNIRRLNSDAHFLLVLQDLQKINIHDLPFFISFPFWTAQQCLTSYSKISHKQKIASVNPLYSTPFCFKKNSREMVGCAPSVPMHDRLNCLSTQYYCLTRFGIVVQNLKVARTKIDVMDLSTSTHPVNKV